MSPFFVTIVMFGLLISLIILRVPVSYSLGFAVLPILFLTPRITPVMLLSRMMLQYGTIILIAIPFFLLAANIMNESGITKQLIRFSQSLVGWLPGGLGHINVLVSMVFAGMSGSSNADAAGIGGVLIPAMVKEGYDKNFTVAVTACSAVMGVIIPPSITMIVWGGTLSTSVSGLFLAGFIPGVMIAVFQMILVYFYARKRNYPIEAKFNLKEFFISFKASILALFTPLIVIGGILGGFVTPTEASLLAVIYALILGLIIFRSVPLKGVSPLLLQTGKMASLVLFAVGTASIYSWVLAYFKIPQFLVNTLGSLTTSPTVMLLLFTLIFLFVGTFMDSVPAIVILGPLLKPLAESVGIHPLHFGIVGIMSLAFGLVTPPYGLCLLIASEIAGINCMRAMKEVGAFLFVMLIVLLIVICFPNISLFIPRIFMPSLFSY
jgi:tripartite ATP-independent transporter DctM subunit